MNPNSPPDAQHWEQLQDFFHLAENTPDSELDAFLKVRCADPELCESALNLIRASRTAAPHAPPRFPLDPRRIGPYTVLRHLGSGGIGTVYLVERLAGGTIQRSALKVLSIHAAGPFFSERFTREQHILASLHHPNITRMEDAGLNENGEPYLVMEYVDGVHLDAFCDDRALPVAERLKLFADICDAVAYAHRNLIVHLDLKPSNILVTTSAGQPSTVKLLDFGTSKLIEPDKSLTTTVLATPAYASPEQLRNEPVTTACDIYALGAILFELLCGRRPNQDTSVAVMIERSLKELPPEPLPGAVAAPAAQHRGLSETRLRSLLMGDLATITAKCLNPRPQDRYASVDALVIDLDRYLQGRPILARPQTTIYRLGKFVRRHRSSVLAAGLAFLALTASLSYAAWRQHQAVIEGRRALQMQTFMTQLFHIANSDYMGKPAASVPELLQLGIKVLPDFITNPADRRAARLSLAESMANNGDFRAAEPILLDVVTSSIADHDLATEVEAEAQAGNLEYNLSKFDQGLKLTTHALSLVDRREIKPDVRVLTKDYYAFNQEENGRKSEQTLKLQQGALAEAQQAHLPERSIASAMTYLGLSYETHSRMPEAQAVFKQALAIYEREPYAACDQGLIYRYLGSSFNWQQDVAGSLPYYRKSYERLKICSGEDSLRTLGMQGLIANAVIKLGDPQSAIPILEGSLPHWRKAAAGDEVRMEAPLLFLTRAYLATRQFDKAEPVAAELNRIATKETGPKSSTVGVCQEAWALALAGQRRFPEAVTHARLAVAAFPDNPDPGERVNAGKAQITLDTIERQAAAASLK